MEDEWLMRAREGEMVARLRTAARLSIILSLRASQVESRVVRSAELLSERNRR